MSTRSQWISFLIGYATYLPVILTWIVGIVICLVRWKRHPKISMLALIGIGGQLILFVINMIVSTWASTRFYGSDGSWTSEQITTFYTVKAFVSALIEAGLWALLLYAIFALRGEQNRFAGPNYTRPAAPMA